MPGNEVILIGIGLFGDAIVNNQTALVLLAGAHVGLDQAPEVRAGELVLGQKAVDILPVAPPPAPGLTSAQQTLELITAMQHLAQQQVDLEARQTVTDARVEAIASYLRPFVQDTRQRLTALELRLDPKSVLTEDQAAEIALAVKHVGQQLAAQGERTGYARVYSELYRRFGISSYKNLPQSRYDEALAWLRAWYAELGTSTGETAGT